jgi:hypothetical protein
MRSLVFSLLIFISVLVKAQSVSVNFDVVFNHLESKEIELCQRLWNEMKTGDMPVYRNDSFATRMSFEEIEKYAIVYSKEAGKVSSRAFNPKIDFKGILLIYSNEKVGSFSKNFELIGIAPLWTPTLSFGIELEDNALFLVKSKDFIDRLSKQELLFYSAFFNLRTSIGDYRNNRLIKDDYIEVLDVSHAISGSRLFSDNIYNAPYGLYDSAISFYVYQLPSYAAEKALHDGIIFYSDSSLTKPITNFDQEYPYVTSYQIPDTSGDDDSFKEVSLNEEFSFNTSFGLTKLDKDLVFVLENTTEVESTRKKLYCRYKDAVTYLENDDVNIFESLVSRVTNDWKKGE